MDKALLMQKEIEEKRKLPIEVKDKIDKSVFYNFIMAIIIMLYLCSINLLFYLVSENEFNNYIKILALGIVLVTVTTFEIAYRRDSAVICIVGIELLVCSILSLYIPYIYLHSTIVFRTITMCIPIIFAIYYVAKSIIIYLKDGFNYRNNLSDIKEIINDDSNRSYLDEDSRKILREKAKV